MCSLALAIPLLALLSGGAGAQEQRPELERSRPPAGAGLRRAPTSVELFFSRPVERDLLTVSVLDECAQEVGSGLTVTGARATVALDATPRGRYTVVYELVAGGRPRQHVIEFEARAGPRCTTAGGTGGGDGGENGRGDGAHQGGHGGAVSDDASNEAAPARDASGGAVLAAVGISLAIGVVGGLLLRSTDAR
jgi:methionine-rich copper-binding protein CopC